MAFINRLRNIFPITAFSFSKPLVLFQSDDWGLVGIRDHEGFEELRTCGLNLGNHPHDFYSFETGEDLHLLYDVLLRHHDSIGRHPCFVFNFVVSNVNFSEVVSSGFKDLKLLPLDGGLPGKWQRPGLLEAYREGIAHGLIYPAFHGLTHFCQVVAEKVLQAQDERSTLLRTLYMADTPLIYYRTPWISFEYRDDSDGERADWLDFASQHSLIKEGIHIFKRIFGISPDSACAPGYKANDDTRCAWTEMGIQIAQNGPGLSLAPHFDKSGLLHLYRNVPFEPALDPSLYDEVYAMKKAEEVFKTGKPVIICMHSINFHSTLKNYRDLTLSLLDRFLTMLEEKYKDLYYVDDGDLFAITHNGGFDYQGQRVSIAAERRWQWSPALASHFSKGQEAM